jgi:CBS domain-containing protein
MKTVKTMLLNKNKGILSTTPDATVFTAIQLMSEKNVGALLVIDNEKLAGIITERDYTRKVILEGRSSKETLVKEIMTRNVLSIRPDNTNEECMALMTEKHLRHLPVIDNERVIGMISIRDVVKAIMSEQHFTIEELQSDRNLRNLVFRAFENL